MLADALAEGLSAGEPRMVTLVGPPGIGKSRQVWELYQRVEQSADMVFWRQGRSLPYGDGVTFWALAEIIKGHAGILATDPAAIVEEKLRIAVEDVVADANEARWIEGHLSPLAGLTTCPRATRRPPHRGVHGLAPVPRGDRRPEPARPGLRGHALGRRQPARVHRRTPRQPLLGPLLVLVTGRPELIERRPGWGVGRSGAATLELAPLSDDETERLVANLLEALRPPAGASLGPARQRGREPALRGGVRAHAARPRPAANGGRGPRAGRIGAADAGVGAVDHRRPSRRAAR